MSFFGRLMQNVSRTLAVRRHEKLSPKVFMGNDQYGNKYFEQKGSKELAIKDKRWVEAIDPDPARVPQVPIEWDSWLRGRRSMAPTEDDLIATEQRVAKGKEKSAEGSLQESDNETLILRNTEKVPFPRYDDYDFKPGGWVRNKN